MVANGFQPSNPVSKGDLARMDTWVFSAASRIAGFFVALTLALGAGSSTAAASAVAFPDIEAKAGDQAILSLDLSDARSISAFQLDLTFDADALTRPTALVGKGLQDHRLDIAEVSPGRLRLVVTTAARSTLLNRSPVEVRFEVAPDAEAAKYPVEVDSVVLVDGAGRRVRPVSLSAGSVTVSKGSPAPIQVPTLSPVGLLLLAILLGAVACWILGPRRMGLAIVIAGVVFASTLSIPPAGAAGALHGDANADGVVDLQDIPAIIDSLLGRGSGFGDPDCTRDGIVDVLDADCVAAMTRGDSVPERRQPSEAFSTSAISSNTASPAGATGEDLVFANSFEGSNDGPTLTAIDDLDVRVGDLVSLLPEATDPDLPNDLLFWSLVQAPTGAGIDPQTGALTWVPADDQLGANAITIFVRDATSAADSVTFTVNVRPLGRAPSLNSIADTTATVGMPFSRTATASDPDLPNDLLSFSLLAAPSGADIDSQTGAISWLPALGQEGLQDITVQVQDQEQLVDFETFVVEVREANGAPLAADDLYTVRTGESLSVTVGEGILDNDSDPNRDALTVELVEGPQNGSLTLQPDGAFTYTPNVPPPPGTKTASNVELTALALYQVGFSSEVAPVGVGRRTADRAVDQTIFTRWQPLSQSEDPAPWLEVELDEDVTVRELQFTGARSWNGSADGASLNGENFLTGRFELLAADGTTVLWDSGTVDLTPPALRQPIVPGAPVGGVRFVRFEGLSWQGTRGAIGELDVFGDGTITSLNPAVEWSFEGSEQLFNGGSARHVHAAPMVVDLDLDGMPEVIFGAAALNSPQSFINGHLVVLDGETGAEEFVQETPELSIGTTVGVGDIDGDGFPEIIAAEAAGQFVSTSRLVAYEHDLTEKWRSDEIEFLNNGGINLADLDNDGTVEILAGNAVLDADGQFLWQANFPINFANPFAIDLNLDGDLEVIFGGAAFEHDGTLIWQDVSSRNGVAAAANIDDDPFPEIVVTRTDIRIFEHDGTLINSIPSVAGSAGAPTLADFDLDGQIEIGVVGGLFYRVLEVDGTELWRTPVFDGSQVTGSTIFDFEGDGFPEVVVRDEYELLILRGTDGRLLWRFPMTSLTRNEFPTIADVDADGHAELLLPGHVGRAGGQYDTGVRVIGGADEDWIRTRRIWNQHAYSVSNINEDGTLPAPQRPNWLLPGLNNFRQQGFMPDDESRADRFIYRVSDGELVAEATVFIDLLPPNTAPEIISTADTTATVGFEYLYAVQARDIDFDPLVFSLQESPPGMTIEPDIGLIRWTPDAAASVPVTARVVDDDGAFALQRFVLIAGQPQEVPNVVGLTETAAINALEGVNFEKGRVSEATDPLQPAGAVISQTPVAGSVAEFGATVDLVLSLGPAPSDVDDDNDGFTENEGDCNDANNQIFPGATDIVGDGIDQNCDGFDAQEPVASIEVVRDAATLLVGEQIDLTAFGFDAEGTSRVIDPLAAWSSSGAAASVDDAGNVQALAAGTATIEATLDGQTGSALITVVAFDAADDTPPTVGIQTPGDGETVLGAVDVVGTASDANLLRYELALSPAGEERFTVIGEGSSSVSNGVLGTFDPTVLLNGFYRLRLTAFDAGGNGLIDEITVQVDGDQKVGNFTVSFTDLEIPLSGIPITVARTYDSRDKRKGEFGVGWQLALNTVEISCSSVPGEGWSVARSGLVFGLFPTRPHTCAVQIPGRRAEVFDFVPSVSISPVVPFSFLSGSWRPRTGTLGSLDSTDPIFLAVLGAQPGEVVLVNDGDLSTFTADSLRYTATDGTQVDFENGSVTAITEPGGNRLTITNNGITHSAGRSIAFSRDAENRITTVTDPVGNIQSYDYSAAGDLVAHTDAGGFTTRYFYDQDHNLLQVRDPLGRPLARNEYDNDGRLISLTDSDGETVTFTHDVAGQQELVTDAAGNTTVLEYDDRGNVVRSTDPLGGVTLSSYDADGNQISTTNPLGETVTRTFDARRNLLSQTNPLGQTQTFAYDERDQLTEATDALGRTTRYEYDSAGRLTRRLNASGAVDEQRAYDPSGNLISLRDANGNVTRFEYDAFGNQTAIIDARGQRTENAFDANGVTLSETDERGTTVTTEVDARGYFTAKTDPLGNTSQFSFNAGRTLTDAADAMGNATSQEVDARGRETAFTDAVGNRSTKSYDALGNLASTTNAIGQTTSYVYDALSRRVRTVNPDGGEITNTFDAAGRVASRTDALGNTTTFEYDAAGRNTRRIDALGNDTRFTYDAIGNLTQQTDAEGNVFEFAYDSLNRRIQTTFPDGSTASRSYDDAGNVVSETDPLGNITSYEYDAADNLVAVTTPDGAETRFTYDPSSNLVAISDALGRTTAFGYDANGRRVSKTYPDGTVETQSYDAGGRVEQRIDAAGSVTTFEHDGNGRVVRTVFDDGTEETFSYTAIGQLETATNTLGEVSYSYDGAGRLSEIVYPNGSTVRYAYDLNGNRTSVETQIGAGPVQTTTYGYDALNRLASVSDADGDVTTYSYDAIGNLASVTYPNGVTSTYSYDTLSRLENLEHSRSGSVLAAYDYTVNAVGDRTRVDHPDGSRVEYTYDARRRLLKESHFAAGGTRVFEQSYSYDAVGNRLSATDLAGSTLSYSYNVLDQLLTVGDTSFSYDPRGNLQSQNVAGAVTTYTFDPENQLAEVSTPGETIRFGYDALGERLFRADASGQTNFLVDSNSLTGVSQVLADFDTGNSRIADYTYGLQLIGQDRGGAEHYHHRDGSLNVRALTDSAGSVSDRYDYAAFGEKITETGSTTNPYQFAGERFQDSEGLTYLRARYYDPANARFISRDPFEGVLRDPVTLHRYLYANANPVSFGDPTGEFTIANVGTALVVVDVALDITSNVLSGASVGTIVYSAAVTGIFAAATGSSAFAVASARSAVFLGSQLVSRVTRGVGVRFAIPLFQAIGDTLIWALGEGAKAAYPSLVPDGAVASTDSPAGELSFVQKGTSVLIGSFIARVIPFGAVLSRFESDVLSSLGGGVFNVAATRRATSAASGGNLFASLAAGARLQVSSPNGVQVINAASFARTATEQLPRYLSGSVAVFDGFFDDAATIVSFLLGKLDAFANAGAISGTAR